MSKKSEVKLLISTVIGTFTVNHVHAWITGSRAGAKWKAPMVNCSKSTIRTAIQEMVESGELRAWYRYGHCYDECLYQVVGKE